MPYDSKYNVLKNYYKKFPKTDSGFQNSVAKSYHRSRKRRRRAHSSDNKNVDENRSARLSRVKKRRKRSHSPLLDFSPVRIKSTKHHQSRSKRSKRKRRLKNQHYGSVSHDSDSGKSDTYELDREELRKAIKRNSETMHKGNFQNIVGNIKDQIIVDDDVIEVENDNEVEIINSKSKDENAERNNTVASDDSDSLEEQTLRLIALKSAIVKKHLDRKKRREIDEKKPYSPSDFDYWCSGINIENSPKDFDELECFDSNNISPPESPINISDEDNVKSVDIDLINIDTDSEEPKFLNSPKMDLSSIDLLKKLAPPPPQITIISPTPIRLKEKCLEETNKGDESKLIISTKNSSPDDLSDEEELALRALLLSTMNSPKVNNISIKKTILTDNSQNTTINKNNESLCKSTKQDKIENLQVTLNDERKEDQDMNSYEIVSLKAKNANKTESLLKEAVKRLKTSTLNDLSENDQIFETNSVISQNKTDRFLNYSVPDSRNSFKEIQTSSGPQVSIEGSDTLKSEELLIESRRKLNRFIKCLEQEKTGTSDYDKAQSSEDLSDVDDTEQKTKISDTREIAENLTSKSCIETLQQIIELNYEKLVRISPENGLNTENEESICNYNELKKQSSEEHNEGNNQKEETFNVQGSKEHKFENNVVDDENINAQINFTDTSEKSTTKNIDKLAENFMQDTVDTSLEITKKIESLQKLSDSIEQTTKITAKAKASLDVSKPKPVNINLVQSRKIVKINKIINQPSQKGHNISTQSSNLNKLVKLNSKQVVSRKSPPNINEASIISNRVSKINKTTGKLIITVGVTSSSEDDDYLFDPNEKSNKNIDSNYDDNASPMSFQMDSPCYSPYPAVSISEMKFNEVAENMEAEKSLKENLNEENKLIVKSTNDVFQAKLDKFLKNARTQVELGKKAEQTSQNLSEPKTPMSKLNPTNTVSVTPIAVRHLPESSQLEYRMLINRMKILERQKLIKQQPLSEPTAISDSNVDAVQNMTESNTEMNNSENVDKKVESDSNLNVPLDKGPKIAKNETSTVVDEIDIQSNSITPENFEQSNVIVDRNDKTKQNLDLIKKYEIAHDKNSTLILENLNRALKFVKMGKEVKTRKVLLESKLEKLKAELKLCETDLKLQNQKIAKIYPAISKSYETIVHLKSRRIKLSKISKQLGKSLNDNTPVLKEGLSVEIQNKFKHLSNEINHLKNLKISDIENYQKESQQDINNARKVSQCKESEFEIEESGTEKHNSDIEKKNEITNINKEINQKDVCKDKFTENIDQTINKNHFESTNNKTEPTSDSKDVQLNQEEPIFDEPPIFNVLTEGPKDTKDENFEYISPLEFLNERESSSSNFRINPNEIICPFQLMGQCDDKDCKYNHLSIDGTSEQSKK
ncbi:uncharacterized protein LOC129619258 isoform X2 [Condylostylus longicornis]|nr:uncharacterized protein LOC129619258 isoform X2 [Condylostylus longicornis]